MTTVKFYQRRKGFRWEAEGLDPGFALCSSTVKQMLTDKDREACDNADPYRPMCMELRWSEKPFEGAQLIRLRTGRFLDDPDENGISYPCKLRWSREHARYINGMLHSGTQRYLIPRIEALHEPCARVNIYVRFNLVNK